MMPMRKILQLPFSILSSQLHLNSQGELTTFKHQTEMKFVLCYDVLFQGGQNDNNKLHISGKFKFLHKFLCQVKIIISPRLVVSWGYVSVLASSPLSNSSTGAHTEQQGTP